MSKDPVETAMLKARVKLLLDQPLFGQMILHLEMEDASDWCTTAATDGKKFYYNREFVKSLDFEELVFLHGHETLHVILDHIYRRGNRPKEFWNMACLAWGSEVLMADGSTQPIQRVVPGDYIASPYGPSKVFGNIFSGIRETMEYVVGTTHIRSTPDHKYASNGGFFGAKTICEETGYGYILNETGRKRFCTSELQQFRTNGPFGTDGGKLCKHIAVPCKSRIECESLFAQAIQLEIRNCNVGIGVVVSGGNHRRRRDDINTFEREVLAATNCGIEYIPFAEGLACSERIQMFNTEEQSRQALFFSEHVILGNRRRAEALSSLSRDQEIARTHFAQDNRNSTNIALPWSDARESFGTYSGNSGIKRSGFSVREGSGECVPVFDLITETGVFFANGILTHNCDYIVNYILVKSKVGKMPSHALYNKHYTDDFSAEELCTLLEQTVSKVDTPMDMHLDVGHESVEANGLPGNAPARLSQAEIQEVRDTMRAALMQAAQNTPPGKMPAGIRRLLDKLVKPRINWRQILVSTMRSTIKYDYTYTRLSRRSWSSGLILPGQDVQDRITATAWLDGSGSTSRKMISEFLSECKGIMGTFRDFELTIGTFDTKVYNIEVFTPANAQKIDQYVFKGGGGTVPSCCWDYMKMHQHKPDKVLVFTDGDVGNDFGDPVYADTIFIIHSNPGIKAPYGRTIHYEPSFRS
jgi:predicted metal-dependent peptidase